MRCVLAFVLGMVACGGRIEGPDGGGPGSGSDAGDTASGSSGNGSSPCPLLPPAVGDPCSYPTGNVCKYEGGGLPCQAVECGPSGTWVGQGC